MSSFAERASLVHLIKKTYTAQSWSDLNEKDKSEILLYLNSNVNDFELTKNRQRHLELTEVINKTTEEKEDFQTVKVPILLWLARLNLLNNAYKKQTYLDYLIAVSES